MQDEKKLLELNEIIEAQNSLAIVQQRLNEALKLNEVKEFLNEDTLKKLDWYASEKAYVAEKLQMLKAKEREYAGLVHPDYYNRISDIAELIEKGRADTIKEAINLMLSEDEMRNHNNLMQLQAIRQSLAAEAAAEAAERQREEAARAAGENHCKGCSNRFCRHYGDPYPGCYQY